ncbi:MAG: HAMP domain-containing protein [Oleiphilaceae bacterium]|nr:HAMP domain-containing protein [Oleiphilaceae bacterium]
MKNIRLRFSLFWQMLLVLWLALIIAVIAGHLMVHYFADAIAGIHPLNWSPGGLDPGESTAFYPVIALAPGLVIMTLVSWWWTRRVSAPLRQMETRAYAITDGDMPANGPGALDERRDEIGALSRAFSTLAAQAGANRDHQRTLLRDLCHDLVIPLSRQRKAIELADDGLDQSRSLDAVLRQNRRMEVMTDQVLTLYRLAEKGSDIAREPVNLVRMTHRVLQDATEYAEQRGVDCRLNVAPQCRAMTVLGDPGLLHRALDSVLQNALDRTPPGQSVVLTVSEHTGPDRQRLSSHSKKDSGPRRHVRHIRCDIKDSGPDVDEARLDTLFEPFARETGAGAGRGWELGLATAANIMRSHDGGVVAEQVPGGGLVVSLVWPVFTESSLG